MPTFLLATCATQRPSRTKRVSDALRNDPNSCNACSSGEIVGAAVVPSVAADPAPTAAPSSFDESEPAPTEAPEVTSAGAEFDVPPDGVAPPDETPIRRAAAATAATP